MGNILRLLLIWKKLKAFDPKGVAEFRKEWNLPDKKPVKKKNRGMER